MMRPFKPTRRQLLVAGVGSAVAAGALVVGVPLYRRRPRYKPVPPRDEAFAPVIHLAIDEDDVVRIWLTKAELGQGVMTALPMLVAGELGADWSKVEVVQAEALPHYGEMLTGVSTSVRENWEELRRAGAAAREMLLAAAAEAWGVDVGSLTGAEGRVFGGGREASFGALAVRASKLEVPADPPFRPRSELPLVGTSVPRVDIPDKTTGAAVFSLDLRLPELRHAVLARPRAFGAKIEGFDGEAALAVPGVEAVHALESGVAVVAKNTWTAMKGARAIELRTSGGIELDDAGVRAALDFAAETEGVEVLSRGGGPEGGRELKASFRVPFLAHATLEPQSATARVGEGEAEIWAPTQAPDSLREAAADWLGLPSAKVRVHTTLVGGAFGRRVQTDFAEEAVRLAAKVEKPVKVVFTREDDTRHDFYRPPALHLMRATLDDEGWPASWSHRVVSPSILGQRDPRYGEVDPVAVEGSRIPYAVPRVEVRYANAHLGVPLGFWRSVGHSHTAFAVETFLDELARAGGKDPVELRRRLLKDAPRHLGVLELAAERAGWGSPLPEGRARGVAVHESYGSYVAQVAEVSVEAGEVRVHRVVAAVDAGWLVHPDTVAAQIEGGIIFGLTAALKGEINLEGGAVVQSNFHDYPLLRIGETPVIEVHTVASDEAPGGVGEIAVPPIAPAVANAVAALTGRPVRELPIRVA